MVQTRSMASSPKHPKSGDTTNHLNDVLDLPPASTIQQQLQSMAAAMADLTQQNQDLTRKVHRKKHYNNIVVQKRRNLDRT